MDFNQSKGVQRRHVSIGLATQWPTIEDRWRDGGRFCLAERGDAGRS
jgi:hypothetical protein